MEDLSVNHYQVDMKVGFTMRQVDASAQALARLNGTFFQSREALESSGLPSWLTGLETGQSFSYKWSCEEVVDRTIDDPVIHEKFTKLCYSRVQWVTPSGKEVDGLSLNDLEYLDHRKGRKVFEEIKKIMKSRPVTLIQYVL